MNIGLSDQNPPHLNRSEYDRGEYYLKFYPYDFKAVVFACRACEQKVKRMLSYIFVYDMSNKESERLLQSP
jgi:hypothetical protein